MKKLKLFALLLAVVGLTFASCKKDEADEPATTTETTYIMGVYDGESFLMTNGQMHYFTRADGGVIDALDMAVSDNGDVYVVGEVKLGGDAMPPQSLLFKNNVECSEYSFELSAFCAIALKDNGDIVLAGLHEGYPAVWDGTNRSDLPLGSSQNVVFWDMASIEYVNGNELIVGSCMMEGDIYTPVIWMNRQLVEVGQMNNASAFAFGGTITQGTNYEIAGITFEGNHSKAFTYNSQQQTFTLIPYQWEGSTTGMVNGIVNSSKWNDGSNTIYSLVTEYYEHGYINPITGNIGAVDSVNGGFYVMKNGQVMPQTKYKYPKNNTIASIMDMTMNAKGEMVLVGSVYDMEYRNVMPAYWVNGECHFINPDRYENGSATRVIVRSTKQ